MNIIIFGGSFDPIHLGHVNMALRAANELNAVVYFVPSPIGVWKSQSASKKDKLAMCQLAIEGYSNLFIDEYELKTGKDHNYTIDTVKYFKNKFPNDNLYFLIGGDQADSFHRWNKAYEISKLTQIIYYPRKGYDVREENINYFHMQKIDGIYYQSASSDIRDLTNLSVAPKVLDYIIKHELYFVEKVKSYYTPKRYEHALSVARLCIEIADANNLLLDSLYGYFFIAGYLHDIAKSLPKEQMLTIMENQFPEYIDMPEFSYHQFVGSEIAKQEFGIYDEILLCAIRYHATGRENMTVLEKIVYAADKIDPTRGYDSSKMIEAMKNDYQKGFIMVLKENRDYLIEHNKLTSNPLSDECFAYYLGN